jgi:hypothetical protein
MCLHGSASASIDRAGHAHWWCRPNPWLLQRISNKTGVGIERLRRMTLAPHQGRSDGVAMGPRLVSTSMKPFWLQMRRGVAVLLVAVVVGHAPLAAACVQKSAPPQGMPCCPMAGQQSPDLQGGCAGAAVCLSDCATSLHGACDQPGQTARASAREIPGGEGVYLLAPIWPAPPVAEHQKPPPQGPPFILLAALTGRHTYLATLRLRI